MTREGRIKEAVCRTLTLWKIDFWVTPSVGIYDASRGRFRKSKWSKPGVTDLWGFLPDGRPFWIELKSETGKLTPQQRAFRDGILVRGHLWALVRGVADLEATFKEWVGPEFPISK